MLINGYCPICGSKVKIKNENNKGGISCKNCKNNIVIRFYSVDK